MRSRASVGTASVAPSSCRRELTFLALRNRMVEPESSAHTGTCATSPLSKVAFMAAQFFHQASDIGLRSYGY